MTEKILRRPQVEQLVGLSRSTIYALMASGDFPKPVRIGKRAVGWPESILNDWLTSKREEDA